MLGAEEELFDHLDSYEADFEKFWPELIAFVQESKREAQAQRSKEPC